METNNGTVVNAEIDFDAWMNGAEETVEKADTTQDELEVKEIIESLEEPAEKTEEKPVIEEDKKEETPNPQKNIYKNLVEKLIEKGDWIDASVNIEGEEILISDLDIDEEMFFQLKEAQEKDKVEDIKNNYIPVSDFNETNMHIINIMRQGGDVSQLINSVPLMDKLTLIEETRNENDLASLIYQKMKNAEYEEDYIQMKIQKIIKDGLLDEEGQKVIDEIKYNYNQHAKNQLAEIENTKKEIEKQRSEYKKTVQEHIKAYKLPENDRRAIVDIATKYDETNTSEAIKLINKVRVEDPQRFIDIVMLAKNPELYSNVKEMPIKNKENLKTVKKVLSLNPVTSTKTATPTKVNKEEDFENWLKQ